MYDMKMSFPCVDPAFGLAPPEKKVEPCKWQTDDSMPTPWPLLVDRPVTLDFGRKVAGHVWIEADGPMSYLYASDPEQLALMEERANEPGCLIACSPTYRAAQPYGRVDPQHGKAVLLEPHLSALRLLRIRPLDGVVNVKHIWLEFSAPHMPLAGSFNCSDDELNRIWHMGAYTNLLCTQQNTDALVPVPSPGNGYVIWDGVRRDREVWAGDLRLASLAWLHSYGEPEPVRNSLYMLWQSRHVGCSEAGMIPGSASTHQTFYEWTFWFLVNAWEYYLWAADEMFLGSLLAPSGLDLTLDWVKRHFNTDGFVEATNSWMYVYNIQGEMAALAIVQVAGLEAMEKLFRAGGRNDLAREAGALAQGLRTRIAHKFFDADKQAMRMMGVNSSFRPHYPLDANAWAFIYGIGNQEQQEACLRFLDHPGLQSKVGLRCLWPAFDELDGDWVSASFPACHWVHNSTVWPYPNCYAALARFEARHTDAAFDTLKAFHRPLVERGHCTVWEAMMPDGGLPVGEDGNTLSFCHAWGGAAPYLLHRYVLGIMPGASGFAEISIDPQLGNLD